MIVRHDAVDPIAFDGLMIVDYTAGQENSSSFAEITVPVGVRHRLSRSSRSDKYYYVVQGTVNFTVDDECSTLFPGDVCIIPQGSRFWYTNMGSDKATLILVHTPSFRLECEEFED